jgi:hypothetical protein
VPESALDRAIGGIADGLAVDWTALDKEASTEEEREELKCLRIVHEIGDVHRAPDHQLDSQAGLSSDSPGSTQERPEKSATDPSDVESSD